MSDIMLDLETLSVRPNAVILVIGAIKFNKGETWPEKITDKELKKRDYFYTRITIDSCTAVGMHIDPDTQKWWSEQEADIKYEALEHPNRLPIEKALIDFRSWIGGNEYIKVWGNGSSFDCTILGEAYKQCNMKIPWNFWLERDLRTIMDLGGIKAYQLPQYGKHNALYDCYRQIIGFQRAEQKLKLR